MSDGDAKSRRRRKRAEPQKTERSEREPPGDVGLTVRQITSRFDVDAILRRIIESAVRGSQAHGGYIEQVDLETTQVEIVARSGWGAPPVGVRVPYPGSLAEQVMEKAAPEIVEDFAAEGRPIAEHMKRACGQCGGIVAPLVSEGDALGAMVLVRRPEVPRFTQLEVDRITTLADLAALTFRRVLIAQESERRRRALEESERRFALFVESVVDYAIFMLDPEGRIVSWNPGASRLKGYSADEIIGRHFSVFHGQDDVRRGRPAEELRTAAETGRYREEGWRFRKDGTRFWADVTVTAIRDHEGVLLGFGKVIRDLTERRSAEDRLRQEKERAEEASRAKSRFLAVASHELRTPLSAILGYERLLEEGLAGPLAEGQVRPLQRIRASAIHLVELVDEILTLSRVEAGRPAVRPEPTDLAALAREAAEMIQPSAEERGLRLVVDLAADPVGALTDPRKVRRILLNLLRNSVSFTNEGEVRLELEASADTATFRVRDTGIGIAADSLEKVFEPFWQEDRGLTRETSGAGLGLSIARVFAGALGGELTVESEPGTGSTFTVRVPLEWRPKSEGGERA